MSERGVAMAETTETITRYRFSVEEYHRMGEAGIFGNDHRVELIRGEILKMAAIGNPHAVCVNKLNDAFDGLRAEGIRSVQNPLTLADSEPQPDLVLFVRRDDYYASARPRPADALLVVEVAETTLRFDRGVKGPLYAESGIREYWLVDLKAERIQVHRRPEGDAWGETFTAGRGESVSLEAFPDFSVAVDDVLP